MVDNMGVFSPLFAKYQAVRQSQGSNIWLLPCGVTDKILREIIKYDGKIISGSNKYYQGCWLRVYLPIPRIDSKVVLRDVDGKVINCLVDSIIVDRQNIIEHVYVHNVLTHREIFTLFVENGMWHVRENNNLLVEFSEENEQLATNEHYRFMIYPRFSPGSIVRSRLNPHKFYLVSHSIASNENVGGHMDVLMPGRLLITEAILLNNNERRFVRLDYIEGWKFCTSISSYQ